MKSYLRVAANRVLALIICISPYSTVHAASAAPAPLWQKTIVDPLALRTTGPDVAVADDGAVHLGYYVDLGTQIQVRHARSTDTAWDIQPIITDEEEEQGDRVRIELDSQSRPHVIYHVFDNGSNGTIKHGVLDNGAWQVTSTHRASIHGRLPDLAIDSFDRPHVSIHDNGGEGFGAYHSVFDGGVWTVEAIGPVPAPAFSGNLLTTIEVDAAGTVYAAGTRSSPLVLASNASGVWTFESVAGSAVETADMELDSAANPYLSWANLDLDTVNLAWRVGGQWHYETVDGDASRAQVSLALDAQDRPRLSYFVQEGSQRILRVAIKTPLGWQYHDLETYPNLAFGNNHASIAIGPNHRTLVAYGDETRGLVLATLVPEPSALSAALAAIACALPVVRRRLRC